MIGRKERHEDAQGTIDESGEAGARKKGNMTYPYLNRQASHVTNLLLLDMQSKKAVIQEPQTWNTPAIELNTVTIGSDAAVIKRLHY